MTEEKATMEAIKTWGTREPLFHISSPKNGWSEPKKNEHHDYIAIEDFPAHWLSLILDNKVTLEVEAKAKELAIFRIAAELLRKLDIK
jgi:UV DNA damage endonuclease